MKPTINEQKTLSSAQTKLISIFAIAFSIVALVFAKIERPEYRQPTGAIVTKSLNTSYQLSSYRDAMVTYSVGITSTLTLSGGQSGTVNLQTSPNNSTWTTVATSTNNNTGTLTVGLNTSNGQASTLTCFVPMGYYIRISTTGTSTFAYVSGMEVLL